MNNKLDMNIPFDEFRECIMAKRKELLLNHSIGHFWRNIIGRSVCLQETATVGCRSWQACVVRSCVTETNTLINRIGMILAVEVRRLPW